MFKKLKILSEYFKNAYFSVGIFLFTILLLLVIFAPMVTPHDPYKGAISSRLTPPSWMEGGTREHIIGTDGIGRDLFTRILYGLRVSFLIAFTVVLAALTIGSTLGLIAGYFGGFLDNLISSIIEIQLSFPFIILAVSILSLTTPTIFLIIVVLTLSSWPEYARVVRSSVFEKKNIPYVYAAYSMGTRHSRVIKKYLASQILPNVVVVAILDFAAIVILETILGFLGIGVRPPTPSLGNIMADGKKYLSTAWWIFTLPGGALFLCLLSLNLIGEGIRETMGIKRLG